jgi:hypothetical protein
MTKSKTEGQGEDKLRLRGERDKKKEKLICWVYNKQYKSSEVQSYIIIKYPTPFICCNFGAVKR